MLDYEGIPKKDCNLCDYEAVAEEPQFNTIFVIIPSSTVCSLMGTSENPLFRVSELAIINRAWISSSQNLVKITQQK